MRVPKYTVPTAELLLIFPAALFMTALFVRNLQPQQYEPAHTAQQIVTWYAVRPRIGLWGFLIALPLAVLIIGSSTLLRRWRTDADLREALERTRVVLGPHVATLLVAAATLTSLGVLAIVFLHMLTE